MGDLPNAASQQLEKQQKTKTLDTMKMSGKVIALTASQTLVKRRVEVDFVDPPAVDSAADLFTGSRTKAELTILISCLMEGEDPEALKRECGSELLEEAISVLESRI
jgi:hypothetical protein